MSLNSLHSDAGDSNTGLRGAFRKVMAEEIDDLKKPLFWRAVFAEFLGCLLLVFFGIGAGMTEEGKHHSSVHIILAAGFFIAVILSALSNISGAHVNPALSLAFAVTRDISVARFIFYTIAQSTGAIVGTALLKSLTPSNMHGNMGLLQPNPNATVQQALVVEMIISFFLVFVIFSLIDKGRKDVSGSIPFIVGLTVCVNIFYSGHISGGCINPIRNLGPAVITGNLNLQWIYWVGPMIGAVMGGLLYDKVFSVMAEKQGFMACVEKRVYQAVDTEDMTSFNKDIEVEAGSSTPSDLPKKRPLSGSVDKVAAV